MEWVVSSCKAWNHIPPGNWHITLVVPCKSMIFRTTLERWGYGYPDVRSILQMHPKYSYLVGGWTNPFEQICSSDWMISLSRGENKKSLKPRPSYPTPKTNLLPPKYLPGPCGIPRNFLRPPEVQESPPPRMFQIPGDLLMSHGLTKGPSYIGTEYLSDLSAKFLVELGTYWKEYIFLRIMQDKSDKS